VPWTLPALRRDWNRAKDQIAPWWAENSKEAYSSGLDGLARALKNWADSKHGRRKGRPMGFPHKKRKGRARDACRFTTGGIKVLDDRKHVRLPKIGVLKTHESTRKLARRLEHGSARILAATITRTADRWYVSFTVEVQRDVSAGNGSTSVIGVDAGIRHLATLSTGANIPNPRALQRSLRKLRRLNRQLHRRMPSSNRRGITRRKLSRVHARTTNLRRDALHKLTTTLATQSSPPPWPPSTAPSWSSSSTWPACCRTGVWPGPWPMPAWPNCAASSPIRRPGTAAGWWSPTGSIRRPRRARPVAG
jgi:putative transposase